MGQQALLETKLLVSPPGSPSPHRSAVHLPPELVNNFIFTQRAPRFISSLFLATAFAPHGLSSFLFSLSESPLLQEAFHRPLSPKGLFPSQQDAPSSPSNGQRQLCTADMDVDGLFSYKLLANALFPMRRYSFFFPLNYRFQSMDGEF